MEQSIFPLITNLPLQDLPYNKSSGTVDWFLSLWCLWSEASLLAGSRCSIPLPSRAYGDILPHAQDHVFTTACGQFCLFWGSGSGSSLVHRFKSRSQIPVIFPHTLAYLVISSELGQVGDVLFIRFFIRENTSTEPDTRSSNI